MSRSPSPPFSPACERNKGPILAVLEQVLPRDGTVLEIGSGTGQHVVYFSAHLPHLRWQPSEREENLAGLRLRLQNEGGANILPPLTLDVRGAWPNTQFEAVFSANTAHIMSWAGVCDLFAGVAHHLAGSGVFCLYGPFNENGEFTAPSNAAFHEQLRRENPEMGLRDITDLENLADRQQLRLVNRFSLPANNQILQFSFAPGYVGAPGKEGGNHGH
jgi:cyclopropane fatty-acyl-phospholipid synthase-like methyltransferase